MIQRGLKMAKDKEEEKHYKGFQHKLIAEP
jgi:hypothetical protein